jgi:hypothetical protein
MERQLAAWRAYRDGVAADCGITRDMLPPP